MMIPVRHTSLLPVVLVFGLLLAGCGGGEAPDQEEFTFTADDLARFRQLANNAASGAVTGSGAFGTGSLALDLPGQPADTVIDLSLLPLHESLRAQGNSASTLYRVTNDFLNIRDSASVTAAQIGRLENGETLDVLEFPNAAWAKVKLKDGTEGFVSLRHISKLVSEEALAAERATFDGKYFVDFGFLNVRSAPNADAEQIGELAGQTIIEPVSIDDVWARINFNGREAYVARQYLTPFQPNFLVRQDRYQLPILSYDLSQEGAATALAQHAAAFKEAGFSFTTVSDFYDHVLEQEQRDVRLPPRSVAIAITGIANVAELDEAADVLRASGVPATFFLQTSVLGTDGAIEQRIQTLLANGFDIQSAAHSGDDLRSLTNAQLELELQQSRVLLEELTGRTIIAVMYPLGGFNERVTQQTAGAGYLFGFSTREDKVFTRSQFLEIPSITTGPNISAESLIGRLQTE